MLLNVLLLEDDPGKKHRLLHFLNARKGELFAQVDTTLSVSDTLRLLKDHEYDLLLVDVIVPAVLGGTAHESNSMELFAQLDEGVGIKQPRYSVAISASEELSANARNFFVGRPWGILPYSESSNDCMATIEKICKYIIDRAAQGTPDRSCDVFVLTALMDPEFAALEATSISWEPFEPLDEVQFVKYGRVNLTSGEKIIAAAFAPRMGPVASAILVSKVILKLKPKLLIMCGICAGIKGKASIGDVIAADSSWDWQSGKYVDKGGKEHFEIAPHQIPMDERTRAQVTLLKRDTKFWSSLDAMAATVSQDRPKLVLGPIATGSAVLADSRVSERIKATQHRNVAGLDMEVYGVYAAAVSCDPKIRFLALKSVCDNGDKQKDDKFQQYASNVAALAVAQFIREYADLHP